MGIEDLVSEDLIVYPNPAQDIFNFEQSSDIQSISLFNSLGALVYKNKNAINITEINVSKYNRGIYLLQTTSLQGKVISKKIILK